MNQSQVALGAPSIQKLISSNPCYNKENAPLHHSVFGIQLPYRQSQHKKQT